MDRDKQDMYEAGRYRNSTFDAKHGIDENKTGYGIRVKWEKQESMDNTSDGRRKKKKS